jgi:flagellar basal body rod protein FlgG
VGLAINKHTMNEQTARQQGWIKTSEADRDTQINYCGWTFVKLKDGNVIDRSSASEWEELK